MCCVWLRQCLLQQGFVEVFISSLCFLLITSCETGGALKSKGLVIMFAVLFNQGGLVSNITAISEGPED